MDLSKVTRFEVIDHSGHAQISYGATVTRWLGICAELSLQDDGQTLKVFLKDGPVPASEVRAAIRHGLAEFTSSLREDLPQAPGLMTEDVPEALRRQP